MIRTYLAGPISGRKWEEAEAHFESVVRKILKENSYKNQNLEECWDPVSPTWCPKCPFQVGDDTTDKKVWQWYMREGLKMLLTCDQIYMLHGWRDSEGAMAERVMAGIIGMPIFYESQN